jgi:hypothetical protein
MPPDEVTQPRPEGRGRLRPAPQRRERFVLLPAPALIGPRPLTPIRPSNDRWVLSHGLPPSRARRTRPRGGVGEWLLAPPGRLGRCDVEAIPGVDPGDLECQSRQLALVEVPRSLLPDLIRNRIGAVAEPRRRLGEGERGSLGRREVRCFPPGRDSEDAVVAGTGLLELARVHLDADAASGGARAGRQARLALVNGAAGVVIFEGDQVLAVLSYTVVGARIVEIEMFTDPKRLRVL